MYMKKEWKKKNWKNILQVGFFKGVSSRPVTTLFGLGSQSGRGRFKIGGGFFQRFSKRFEFFSKSFDLGVKLIDFSFKLLFWGEEGG